MYCQKCRQPLKLDGSLEDLNPAAFDLLVSSSSSSPQTTTKSSASRPTVSQPQEQARRRLYEKVAQNTASPTFRRHHGLQPRDNAMSFIFLTESQLGHPPSQQQQLKGGPHAASAHSRRTAASAVTSEPAASRVSEMERVNRLFEILSAKSDIDHPVCVECTDMLVEGLQKRLDAASRERDAYVSHLRQVQAAQPTDEDARAWRESLETAERETADALAELKKLEADKDALDSEILALEEESLELDKEEEMFWRERNAFATDMADFQAERDSINAKYSNDSQLLEKLQRSNVYNDTFCISHDGSFATINGLRLGRLSNKPVDWPEINAAWGHALLLLVTVAEKLGYKFQGYDPQPMGSTSRIVRYEQPAPAPAPARARASSGRLGSSNGSGSGSGGPHAGAHQPSHTHIQHPHPPPPKKHVLELYSSGDMPLGLTFMHRKFDNAMVAFLELVRQLGVFVQLQTESSGSPLALPYKIEGERIGDTSIKLGIAQDDGWTKACKLTLTCCKFLLAHASNVSSNARSMNNNNNNRNNPG